MATGIFDLLLSLYNQPVRPGTTNNAATYVRPVGNYAGEFTKAWTPSDTIITNPWGVQATFGGNGRFGNGLPQIYLAPGQSYDTASGRYNDPTIHAATAARLNTAVQSRAVQEAGLTTADRDTARGSTSVLATLDQLYWGNVNTEASPSSATTNLNLANQTGLNTSGTRTILGADAAKKPTTTTALKRALT